MKSYNKKLLDKLDDAMEKMAPTLKRLRDERHAEIIRDAKWDRENGGLGSILND